MIQSQFFQSSPNVSFWATKDMVQCWNSNFLVLTNTISVSWEMEKYQAYHVKWDTPVGRAHIAYLISWDATYIFIGQLHLTSIGFKKKFNMVSEPITHLGQSPILGGGCWKIPHRLPQFLGCSLYI